jgi:hypothetical protein
MLSNIININKKDLKLLYFLNLIFFNLGVILRAKYISFINKNIKVIASYNILISYNYLYLITKNIKRCLYKE